MRAGSRKVVRVLGYDVTSATIDSLSEEMGDTISKREGCRWLACLNPHSYAIALKNEPFRNALADADWLVPDGMGIVLASKLWGDGLSGRITGFDVFEAVHGWLEKQGGGRVFFVGSTEETLAKIRGRMSREHPTLTVAGTLSPPFVADYSDTELSEMVEAINRASADVLWVGLSAPKQEIWIHRVKDRLNVRFAGAIGAVFDFYTGRIKRSHPAFRALGLEWLPRLAQEPRRLWRRTFVSAPIFVLHALAERLGGRKNTVGR